MLVDLCLLLTASKNQPVKSEATSFLKEARRSDIQNPNYTTVSATIPRHTLCGLSGLIYGSSHHYWSQKVIRKILGIVSRL